jgi:hypothetical protein
MNLPALKGGVLDPTANNGPVKYRPEREEEIII